MRPARWDHHCALEGKRSKPTRVARATRYARVYVADARHGRAGVMTAGRVTPDAGAARSRRPSRLLRLGLAICLVLVTVALAVAIIGSRGQGYWVRATFQNASQIVKGDRVEVSGLPVGTVTNVAVTPNSLAELTMRIDAGWAPLRRGTLATIRQASLSGIANRYVLLQLPGNGPKAIPTGGEIPTQNTTSTVDIDQIFNTLDPSTRRGLSGVIQGFAEQYRNKGSAANAGFLFLDPALSTSSQLLAEIDRDTPLLERFVVANSQLATNVAARHDQLTALIQNLALLTGAIGRESPSLSTALHVLPNFMVRANHTFVNLRGTLDDLKPLIDASKPVAVKLSPYLINLRAFAAGAQPTIHDLSQLVRSPRPNSDLISLTQSNIPLRDIAIGPVLANGQQRPGALPAATSALAQSTPEMAFGRPYTPDLMGWFNDFSHTGATDALGGFSRSTAHANAFSLQDGVLSPIPPQMRAQAFQAVARTGLNNRCPGSDERPSPDSPLPFRPSPSFNCDPSQTPVGK